MSQKSQLPSQSRRVSYIITIFNKTAFIPRVVQSLAEDGGDFEREYIFVDDGSTDGSAEMLEGIKSELPGKTIIIVQENSGASFSTNAGVKAAKFEWVRLLDGDDLIVPGSTERMLNEAISHNMEFAYGDLEKYSLDKTNPNRIDNPQWQIEPLTNGSGLLRFIRNCPANSSSMLFTKNIYILAGGCNEEMISPDQVLFLRIFTVSDGVRLVGPVALIPDEITGNAPARLSSQVRRSRYESVMALINLVLENPNLEKKFVVAAYRRALSRAYNYHRMFGGIPYLTMHFVRYMKSKVLASKNPVGEMRASLTAFTEDGSSERPEKWKTGASRHGQATINISGNSK